MKVKTYFITYADSTFRKSAQQLCREAMALNAFNCIQIFRPNQIPEWIKNSPIFHFQRGGGYWIWKPFIIVKKLQEMNDGDILCYSDAGNILYPTDEWQKYFDYLELHDALFFQYQPKQYDWGNPALKYWIKKSAIDYFRQKSTNENWLEQPKFWAGLIFARKSKETLTFFEDWLNILLFRSDLLFDPFGIEKLMQSDYFIEHRHDQAILSGMLLGISHNNFIFLPENSEEKRDGQTIFAARRKDLQNKPIRRYIKSIIGIDCYNRLKTIFKR